MAACSPARGANGKPAGSCISTLYSSDGCRRSVHLRRGLAETAEAPNEETNLYFVSPAGCVEASRKSRRPRTKRLISHQIYFFLLAQKSFAFLYFDCSGVTVFFGGPPNAFLGAAGALGLDGANWMPAGFDAGAGLSLIHI